MGRGKNSSNSKKRGAMDNDDTIDSSIDNLSAMMNNSCSTFVSTAGNNDNVMDFGSDNGAGNIVMDFSSENGAGNVVMDPVLENGAGNVVNVVTEQNQCLQLNIYNLDHPNVVMDETDSKLVIDHIQTSIRATILDETSTLAPRLMTRKMDYGIQVTCVNKETLDWLWTKVFPQFDGKEFYQILFYRKSLSMNFFFSVFLLGPKIRVDQGKDVESLKFIKCCLRLKKRVGEHQLTFEQLKVFVRKQNPELKVNLWKLYNRVDIGNDLVLLYFGVDELDYKKLEATDGSIYFDTGKVRIQLDVNTGSKRVKLDQAYVV